MGQDYFAYALKKYLQFAFFKTYHAFKSREGVVSQPYLAVRLKIFCVEKPKIRPIYFVIREAF